MNRIFLTFMLALVLLSSLGFSQISGRNYQYDGWGRAIKNDTILIADKNKCYIYYNNQCILCVRGKKWKDRKCS